jgi:hypothetical protein
MTWNVELAAPRLQFNSSASLAKEGKFVGNDKFAGFQRAKQKLLLASILQQTATGGGGKLRHIGPDDQAPGRSTDVAQLEEGSILTTSSGSVNHLQRPANPPSYHARPTGTGGPCFTAYNHTANRAPWAPFPCTDSLITHRKKRALHFATFTLVRCLMNGGVDFRVDSQNPPLGQPLVYLTCYVFALPHQLRGKVLPRNPCHQTFHRQPSG